MTHPDRRRQIDEICDAALDLAAAERRAFVASACGSDEGLRREVEAMLTHAETAERFLTPSMVGELAANSLAADSHSMVNRIISHYRVVERLGAGGMGIVYRAEDTRLQRSVALKFLAPELTRDEDAKHRFVREAQSASALEHPNICTIHEIDESPDGQMFLAMAYYAGETLKAKIERGPLAIDEVQSYAIQIAEGLSSAHAAGIVHRDIKPANLLVTRDGVVKIVDFGIAKLRGQVTLTRPGSTFGTLAYMSPEQVAGSLADARSDLWSLGVVLYEMVAGRLPFRSEQAEVLAVSIKQDIPEPLSSVQQSVPIAFERIVNRLLAKRPENRFQTAAELLPELKRDLHRPDRGQVTSALSAAMKIAVALGAIVLIVGSVALGLIWRRSSQERWALETAAPEITRLVGADEYVEAAALIQKARAVLPQDPTLKRLWTRATEDISATSVPSEADVSMRPFGGDPNTWQSLGKTPLKNVRVPKTNYIWRVSKPGFASTFVIAAPPASAIFTLWPEHTVPADMAVVIKGVRVVLGWPFNDAPRLSPDDFLIDQHEVTNEDFKIFVDAGAYVKPEFWTEPFVKDGQTIPWQEAVALFRDTTGRLGPATWEAGSFPKGLEKHPVAGVSWYEAAAYARFAGKSLPTVYHWTRAAQTPLTGLIFSGGNFSGAGTVPVGGAHAVSGFGTTDMAGNVKEWCLNESSEGKRFILGGGFGEPTYMFNVTDVQSPWERRANYGFRGVKLTSPLPPAATAKLERAARDVWNDKIVPDEIFAAFKGMYAYDHADLNAHVEETQAADGWTWEKISFAAAYDHERVTAHLYLPKNVAPPYQTVVVFPSADALQSDRFDPSSRAETGFDFLLQGGRAVMVPIYKGTFERRDGVALGGPGANPPALWRDHVIAWSKDLGRSIDYLETRQDIDRTKIAYSGFSFGGAIAPVLLAVETRFKAAVLKSGGFWFQRPLPEADGTNFVTRVKIPVLMLSGRDDAQFPVDSAQLPLFRRLGTLDENKRHLIYNTGHSVPHKEEVRETLDWLDHYLGPVRR